MKITRQFIFFALSFLLLVCEVRGHEVPCSCNIWSSKHHCCSNRSAKNDTRPITPSVLDLGELVDGIQFAEGYLGSYYSVSDAVKRLANSRELAPDDALYMALADSEQPVHVRTVAHVTLVERHRDGDREKFDWVCVEFSPVPGPLSQQKVSRPMLEHWTAMWGVYLGVKDAHSQLSRRLSNQDVTFVRRLNSSRVVPSFSPSAGIYLCNVPKETLHAELQEMTQKNESYVIAHVLLTLAMTDVRTADADDSFFGLEIEVVEDETGLSEATIDNSQRPRIETLWRTWK